MPQKGRSNQDWYARLGYEVESEEELYPVKVDGEQVLLWAVWMRKEI